MDAQNLQDDLMMMVWLIGVGDVDPAFKLSGGQFVRVWVMETGRVLRPHGGADGGYDRVEAVIVGEAIVADGFEVGERDAGG